MQLAHKVSKDPLALKDQLVPKEHRAFKVSQVLLDLQVLSVRLDQQVQRGRLVLKVAPLPLQVLLDQLEPQAQRVRLLDRLDQLAQQVQIQLLRDQRVRLV